MFMGHFISKTFEIFLPQISTSNFYLKISTSNFLPQNISTSNNFTLKSTSDIIVPIKFSMTYAQLPHLIIKVSLYNNNQHVKIIMGSSTYLKLYLSSTYLLLHLLQVIPQIIYKVSHIHQGQSLKPQAYLTLWIPYVYLLAKLVAQSFI